MRAKHGLEYLAVALLAKQNSPAAAAAAYKLQQQ